MIRTVSVGSVAPVVAGAVLCGGASRRMGVDKATLLVQGEPMAVRVARALELGGCRPVYAVGGGADLHRAIGLPGVADEHPGEGPLGGVITALAHQHGDVTAVFVVACDLPELQPDTVRRVLDGLGGHEVVMAWTDRMEPLCAVWRVGVLAHLRAEFAQGRRSVHEAIAGLDVAFVELDEALLRNVNTPGDLDRLR